jgi:hypothetical protein
MECYCSLNNSEKFPLGYVIEADKGELVKNFDRFKNLKHSTSQPKAFTEKGLYMLATILKSSKATAATIAIMVANLQVCARAAVTP